ncbi:uncharacterized protein LOC128400166 [Podarcis raffonei]|uniref:uncharacterized protein LOC128400166 n=1 Tax=Podarcis raffonei TaxID=65483 RepID=UPI0023294005|nr:uncharacterized protein LOC128400166 [Podarcis raffonei]
MGESSFHCHPSPEGCCLELHETIAILVALIILVHLALKLAAAACYYFCCLLGTLIGTICAKEPETSKMCTTPKTRRTQSRRLAAQWSDQTLPRRRRRESSSPHRRCLHCTLEPLKVTMNLQNEPFPCREHQRLGRRPCPDYLPCHALRCCTCDCDPRQRPRTSSAPSPVTRCRDVACGSSDPMLASGSSNDHRNSMAVNPDYFSRLPASDNQYRSGPEAEYPGTTGRRPTKVYIYPVHPQTPPASRSGSPERSYRRRGTIVTTPEEQPVEYEPRESSRRKSRAEPEQLLNSPLSPPAAPRFHSIGGGPLPGTAPPETPSAKPRYSWPEPAAVSDWVYRPVKQ